MSRRRSKTGADHAADALDELLMMTPWWVGPVLALGVYLVMLVPLPALIRLAGEPLGTTFATVCHNIAPYGGLVVGVIWIIAEAKKFSRRRLLDTQSDLGSLRALTWQQFEQLVGEAFRRQGYAVEETGGGGADGGVDLRLRRSGKTTLVQCKQWKSWKLGVRVVRELYGVMASEGAVAGIVVTCGRFTRDAEQFAAGKPLELIDGPALWELVKGVKAGAKVAESPRKPAATPPPSPASVAASPLCPKCGSTMALRTAKRGPNTGAQFYGCMRYPECRGIVNLESRPLT